MFQLKQLVRQNLLEYEITQDIDIKSVDEFKMNINGVEYEIFFEKSGYHKSHLLKNLSFKVPNLGFDGRVGKDIKHSIAVINNIAYHIEKQALNQKVRYVEFSGIKEDGENGDGLDTVRSKWYASFIKKKYPAEAVEIVNDEMILDMAVIFPDFTDWEKLERGEVEVPEVIWKNLNNALFDIKESGKYNMRIKPSYDHYLISFSGGLYELTIQPTSYSDGTTVYHFEDLKSGKKYKEYYLDSLSYIFNKLKYEYETN